MARASPAATLLAGSFSLTSGISVLEVVREASFSCREVGILTEAGSPPGVTSGPKGACVPSPTECRSGPLRGQCEQKKKSRCLHTLPWGPEAQSHKSPPSGAEAEVSSQEATFALHKGLQQRESPELEPRHEDSFKV